MTDDCRSEREGSTAPTETGVILDPEQLSPEALRGLAEEFVTREGTDYGSARGGGPGDWSLDQKVEQVLGQIRSGDAKIVFDLESETASIVPAFDAD